MKKFLAFNISLITIISIIFPAIGSAGVCTQNCNGVADAIQWFDNYLNGTHDPPNQGYTGGNWINKNLQQSFANAKKWHKDSYLANFTYYLNPGSMDNYSFDWISPSDKTKMYRQWHSETVGQEQKNIFKNSYGIFYVPLTMRKLTKAMLKDKTLLTQLDELFTNNDESYVITTVRFSLEKNSSDKLMWTITFIDGYSEKVYIVTAINNKAGSPTFNITKGTSADIP